MKAAVLNELGGPDALVIEDRPMPSPVAGEAVIEVRAAALNRRDLYITYGQYPGIELPSIMGSDGAGRLSALPPDYDGELRVGDDVVILPSMDWGDDPRVQSPRFTTLGVPRDGTFAEYVAVPLSNIFRMPAHLSHAEAAALPLAGVTAYRALVTRGAIQAGETVLITGAGGGVASIAVQIAVALGATPYVTSTRREPIDLAISLGAAGGVNTTDPDWLQQLKASAGAIDLAVDTVGGSVLPGLVRALRAGGRLVTLGASAGPVPELAMPYVFLKQLDIRGSSMGDAHDFAGLLELVARAELHPHIGATFPLDAAAAAMRHMESNQAQGKIILEP